jgi:hypothetical protein
MGEAVVVGVSLVIILTVTTVFTLRRRSRVRRRRDETPEDRYRREIQHLRPTGDDTWRGRRYGNEGSDSSPAFYP